MKDQHILAAWRHNAGAWTRAVRGGAIASRVAVTNDAIVATVCGQSPRSVLDVGCGEGWLLRALSARGIKGFGIDGVAELVAQANSAGGGEFSQLSYQQFARGDWRLPVDAVVFNFSLLAEDIARLLTATAALISNGGHCFIQTLHPLHALADAPYQDGWQAGSWQGIGEDFPELAPWYFRTLTSWQAMFDRCGLAVLAIDEPVAVGAHQPASIIYTLSSQNQAS